jgi:hypothetical protein
MMTISILSQLCSGDGARARCGRRLAAAVAYAPERPEQLRRIE